jgi:hypothetical protein
LPLKGFKGTLGGTPLCYVAKNIVFLRNVLYNLFNKLYAAGLKRPVDTEIFALSGFRLDW